MKTQKTRGRFSAAFKVGAIALAFLIIGYQSALFIHQAAVERIVAEAAARDAERPGSAGAEPPAGQSEGLPAERSAGAAGGRQAPPPSAKVSKSERVISDVVEKYSRRVPESFPFNPNTIGKEDLQRLGFSSAQAQSIINYREKGGRFHRPADFAKSFVVADSVFRRLEPFISIPRTDINAADSAAFDALPGIGPYYAAKMVEYRAELGGYSFPEQLMEIWNFGQEKFDGLKDLIELGDVPGYPLWTLPESELAEHPYIDEHAARSIVLYRETMPEEEWTVQALADAGILDGRNAARLLRCRISALPE